MKKHFFFIFFFVFSICAYSQTQSETLTTQTDPNAEKHSKMWESALGSFQFQIINSRINPVIPASVITLIEENRLENKVNFIDYKENIRIMILPKSELTKGYKKLEHIKYISTN